MLNAYFLIQEVAMESVRRVRKTDLARNTRQVISAVLRGQTAFIESHGEPEAAIIDIADYRILRATMRYHARHPSIDLQKGLPDADVTAVSNLEERYDLVIAHYLSGSISLARAAQLLDLPSLDLRARFLRLDVPIRTAPIDDAEMWADVDAARQWGTGTKA